MTGLFTQPWKGAEKEGVAGFFKGVAKGIGGIVLKPSAGMSCIFFTFYLGSSHSWVLVLTRLTSSSGACAVPGYTLTGMYRSMRPTRLSGAELHIVTARTMQGYEDLKTSNADERADIVTRFRAEMNR